MVHKKSIGLIFGKFQKLEKKAVMKVDYICDYEVFGHKYSGNEADESID